jgi:MFS family permease
VVPWVSQGGHRWPLLALDRSFAALRTRNYRLFFVGQLISQSGSWMQRVAQAWLVLDLTGSPLALGTVTALQFLPILALTLLGGVLADRMSKRKLLLITQSVQMVQALALGGLVVTHTIQLWQVYALAAVLGITVAVDQPARRAFPSEMVPRPQVPSAVALNSTVFNAARVAGPALGGLAIATIGVGGCFLLNGVSFLAVLIALAIMRPAEFYGTSAGSGGNVATQVVEAVRYTARTPQVGFTLLLLGVLGTFGYNFNVVLPLLARYALGTGAVGFGALNSALGLGSVVGSLLVASQSGVSPRRVVLGASVFALCLWLLALTPHYGLTLVLLFGQGIAGVVFSASANTNLQLLAPDALRGRVMSLYSLVFVGTTPFGAALTGALADHWGVRLALAIDGTFCVLGVVLGLAYLRLVAAHQTPPPLPREAG